MSTPRVLSRDHRFLWLFGYLLAFIAASGLLMVANTTVFGLGDPKFGAGGWLIYWPIWGVFYLPSVFVASLLAELWWRSTPQRLLYFFAFTLGAYLAAMEVSFVMDVQWQALLVEVALLSIATVILARKWFAT
jgi:hypothetical protein